MPADKVNACQKAEEINNISLDYHLSHAMVACEILLQQALKEKCNSRIAEINKEKKIAISEGKSERFAELADEQIRLCSRKRFRVYVEYLKNSDEDSGRTVCIDNQLIICLPQKLLDKTRKPDGTYTDSVLKMRKLVAHELGHAVLHTDKIMEAPSFVGTNSFRTTDVEEQEAIWFEEKLLELRHKRNATMARDGTLSMYF